MSNTTSTYKKAMSLIEIDNAVRLSVPLEPDHEFHTDFSDVRGDFEERMIYKTLNVNYRTFVFNREINQNNKIILFLAGMRGSGKTSELARLAKNMHNKQCFFCITCNLDEGLDVNNLEYMDVLIFQMERLFQDLDKYRIDIDRDMIEDLQTWFSERVKEVNKVIKKEGGFELELKAETPSILSFLGIAAKLKANILGTKENADKIRTVFKSNFSDFVQKINLFLGYVNTELRKQGIAEEILFIIDGLEKIATTDIRKKVILDESNRIRQIEVNTIFTLPIELMAQRQILLSFSEVVSFPFVKIKEKDGTIVAEAISKFEEFVYKRIDASLFDSPQTVRKAILYSGGSPRELLRILERANLYADEDGGKIYIKDLDKALTKLGRETAQYLSKPDLELLKILKEANEANEDLPFGNDWQGLLEKLIVLEYNDGSYKRVNPIIEDSSLYKQYVG